MASARRGTYLIFGRMSMKIKLQGAVASRTADVGLLEEAMAMCDVFDESSPTYSPGHILPEVFAHEKGRLSGSHWR